MNHDRKRRHDDERLFQLLFILSFPLFLALAAGARVLPSKAGDDGAQRSLFSDAAAAARSTIAIALT